MAIVTVEVWDDTGSRQLRQDGQAFQVDIRGGLEAEVAEMLSAIRENLGLDAVLLRIGAGNVIEVECAGGGHPGFEWQPWPMTPPLAERPVWHRPGWWPSIRDAVDSALARHGLTRTGEPAQVRHTSVTGMMWIPTDRFPVWLKAVLPIFAHEGPVVDWVSRIAPGHVPDVVASGSFGWLAREFPSEEPVPRGDFLSVLADIQIAGLGRGTELRALGCADRSPQTVPDAIASIVRESDHLDRAHRDALRSVLPKIDQVCAEITGLGLPSTIVHGDLTVRNVRWTRGGWFLFDWTDACLAHPFVDLAVALDDDHEPALTRRATEYGRAWSAVLPPRKVERALDLAGTLGTAHQLVTYQWILDAFESTGGDPQGGAEMLRLLHYWADRLATGF